MRYILCTLVLLTASLIATAQCQRTCKVTYRSPSTGKMVELTTMVELVTGYTLMQRTGDAMYNGYGGRTIYACVSRKGQSAIVLKVKVGKGTDLVWCGSSPCQVNCDIIPPYTAYDVKGTKTTITPLEF